MMVHRVGFAGRRGDDLAVNSGTGWGGEGDRFTAWLTRLVDGRADKNSVFTGGLARG